MKKERKDLNMLSDEELVSIGKKNSKLCLIFDMLKWGVFITCMIGTVSSTAVLSSIFTIANIINISVLGTSQVMFAIKCSKCKDILKSRGSLYKYDYNINSKGDTLTKARKLTKEELNDCADIFPEFSNTNNKINVKNTIEENER